MNPKQRKERAKEVQRCQKAAGKRRNFWHFSKGKKTTLRFLEAPTIADEAIRDLPRHYITPGVETYQWECSNPQGCCEFCELIALSKTLRPTKLSELSQ